MLNLALIYLKWPLRKSPLQPCQLPLDLTWDLGIFDMRASFPVCFKGTLPLPRVLHIVGQAMITFTPQKTAFLHEHWMAFGQSQHLGTMDAFLEDFFLAWLEHFKEMEYLTAGSDVQVFIKRRMIKILKEKMEEILHGKTPNEKSRLTSPPSFTIRRAGDHTPKGPQRYDPTRTSRGLLPRASGSKRRRAHLDASVIVPPSVPRKQVASMIKMGKEKKKRRVYVHEPEVRTFVATRATKSRVQQTFIEAPAVTEEPPPLSDTLEFALGRSGDGREDSQMTDATVPDTPTDASGLVVRARAKRYVNSVRSFNLI
ncbi:hypothetical protein EYR36_002842 [Pleurotus pulmonarius]|nr:hypothetical protein EYR36_002842 [Pleurotus pulmonarius]